MIDAFLTALQGKAATDWIAYFGVWVLSPWVAFFYVQFYKQGRDAKAPARNLRALASGITFALSFAFGWRMARWPLEDSLNAAIAAAVCYPVLMHVYIARLKKFDAEAAEDIGGDAPTELRIVEPADKGEGK